MLAEVGVRGPLADLALFGGAAVESGARRMLLVNWRRRGRHGHARAVDRSIRFVGLALPTDYWLNPFAPILKNLPIAAAPDRDGRDGAADRRRKTPVHRGARMSA